MQIRLCLKTKGTNLPEGVELLSAENLVDRGGIPEDAYDIINQLLDETGMVVLGDANFDFNYTREDCQLIVQGKLKGMIGFDGYFTDFDPQYQNYGYRTFIALFDDGRIQEARIGRM